MFGYVKPFVPELKVKEHELYKAVYCGLCKSMGRATAALSRLTLSYDIVYLALIRCVLTDTKLVVSPGRCGLNIFKKMPIAEDNPQLTYSAAVSAYLTYYKTLDNIRDSKGLKRLTARFALMWSRPLKKKAEKLAPLPRRLLTEPLDTLHELEEEKSPSADASAEAFGILTANFMSYGLTGSTRDTAYKIGLNTGRFIYFADAADDFATDKKSGSYNPLAYSTVSEEENLKSVRCAMEIAADIIHGELELSDAKDSSAKAIAENIAQLGMIKTARDVTSVK